mmetsp:Transcript_33945/g.25022  ORF Transcript_33945/g.25022 Transcript_33945/m.25022 type:complete len:106 (-) Transcript_33945:147-464(-)
MCALNVPNKAKPEVFVKCRDPNNVFLFNHESVMLATMMKVGSLKAIGEHDVDPEGTIKNHVSEELQTFIKVAGLVDVKLEIERLKKRNNELQKLIEGINKKTSIP